MTEDNRCPDCNASLDPDRAPEAGCPACLLGLALDAGDEEEVSGAERLRPGETVGPYRVVRKLGEGGMGVVFLAEQSEPIQRQVALKVIRHGMDTRSVVARFEAERQALALMDHSAIARVFEAGETESGRPYFVMEYIDGEPITDYCDRRRLGTVERLELFNRVCEGVQHGHQRGIIHRDIKPSNILVAETDGKAAPKIIDFGVAKAVEQPLTGRTELTALGVLLGTPEYMSPEQADLTPFDVDTRTDVYSLGVVLYELLTGALPFDIRELQNAAFDEIRRRIRDVRPSRPSERVSELGDRAADLARSRRSDSSTLSRRLSGDLDLITMKALEKDRALRYGSPAEFAADIGRHLSDEPVLARAPSALYLLRKMISKHRLTATLLAVILVTLLGSSAWLAVLYGRSQANLERALAAETTATQVSDFLVGVFEVSDPGEARGNSATARELLDGAAKRIDQELADQPAVQATLMNTMGRVYRSLGLYEESDALLAEALQRRRELPGEDAAEVAESLNELAYTLTAQGRYDEAEPAARESIEIRESRFGPDALETAASMEALQLIHWHRREHDEALALGLRIQQIRESQLDEDDYDLTQSLNNLGNLYMALGRNEDAIPVLQRALDLRRAIVGPDHPGVATVMANLAEAYRRLGRYEEAEAMLLQVQEIETRVYEPGHPEQATTHNNLGMVYKRMERYDEAAEQYRRALAIREAALPAAHPLIAWTLDNLGLVLRTQGKYDEAEAMVERALEIAREAVGGEHPDTLIVMANLALIRADQGRHAEAEATFREVLALNRKVLPAEHPEIAFTLHNLAQTVEEQGRLDEAIEIYREALAISTAALGADHPDTVDTRQRLERLLAQRN